MSSALASRWTWVDSLIQNMRFRIVNKHIKKNVYLVDIGCGSGRFLNFISDRITRGVGLDSCIEGQVLSSTLELKRSRVDKDPLPIEDDSVDVVTSLAVLEHLNYPEKTVSEALRILQPGGKFILTTPTPAAKPVLEFLAFRCGLISKEDIEDHKHYHSREELQAMFTGYSQFEHRPFQLGFNQLVIATK